MRRSKYSLDRNSDKHSPAGDNVDTGRAEQSRIQYVYVAGVIYACLLCQMSHAWFVKTHCALWRLSPENILGT